LPYAQGKPHAELGEIYFWDIKISTQVLKSLWKSPARSPLTSRPSTLFSGLHNLSATLFFSHAHIFKQDSLDGMIINFWAIAGDAAEANLFFFS
jgi:hypothetical protein